MAIINITAKYYNIWAFLVAQMVKNPPAVWEIWVRSLGWEDLLEEGMVTHSSILAWRITWTEESGGLQLVHRVAKSWTRLKWLSTAQHNLLNSIVCGFDQKVVDIFHFKTLVDFGSWKSLPWKAIQVMFSIISNVVESIVSDFGDKLLAHPERHTRRKMGISVLFATWPSTSYNLRNWEGGVFV